MQSCLSYRHSLLFKQQSVKLKARLSFKIVVLCYPLYYLFRRLIIISSFYSSLLTGKGLPEKTIRIRVTFVRPYLPSDRFLEKDEEASFICNLKNSILGFSAIGLLNLRGFDIKYTPVFFSYAIVTDTSVT